MSKKINLSTPNNSIDETKKTITTEGEKPIDNNALIQGILDKKYPDKMLFDIQTVATELERSYEFVRIRTNNGKIKYIKLGTMTMIPRSEFIKLLTVGVV
jgi:hypothetical protein